MLRRLSAPSMTFSMAVSDRPRSRRRSTSISPSSPEHLHEAAERDPVQGVARSAEHDRADARREADAELLDGHAGPLGDREVTDLVDHDQDDDDRQEGDDGEDDVHQAVASIPSSVSSAVRTSASSSWMASEVRLDVIPPSVDRRCDRRRDAGEGEGAAEEGRDRDLVGGVDDRSAVAAGLGRGAHRGVRREAGRARAGRRSAAASPRGRMCRPGPAWRSGYDSANWIGSRMSGRPSWALYEPSTNSTREWTMLPGWSTAAILG